MSSTFPVVAPSLALLQNAIPISQGAEAKVYKVFLHSSDGEAIPQPVPILLKYRFHKQYRHPSLDLSLTKARVTGEARALLRCLRCGVHVPGIRMVDTVEGVIGIEWIEGMNVRQLLPGGDEEESIETEDEVKDDKGNFLLLYYGISQETLMNLIGTEIAKMHLADIIHGDLTTSNMMLRRIISPSTSQLSQSTSQSELVLIDFGLAYNSNFIEDKAVDLYVLERAFGSTHPDSEPLFASVLTAYQHKVGEEWSAIGKRLDDVRLRGRKRSMVG